MKPYAKAQTIPLVGLADRRRRLTDKQREEIRELYAKGELGYQRIANIYGVSKRLISIIVNPAIAEQMSNRFKANWRKYRDAYGKEYHTRAIRNTRRYKYALYKAANATPKAQPKTTGKEMQG